MKSVRHYKAGDPLNEDVEICWMLRDEEGRPLRKYFTEDRWRSESTFRVNTKITIIIEEDK